MHPQLAQCCWEGRGGRRVAVQLHRVGPHCLHGTSQLKSTEVNGNTTEIQRTSCSEPKLPFSSKVTEVFHSTLHSDLGAVGRAEAEAEAEAEAAAEAEVKECGHIGLASATVVNWPPGHWWLGGAETFDFFGFVTLYILRLSGEGSSRERKVVVGSGRKHHRP